jgi:FkbM family methyltransferase
MELNLMANQALSNGAGLEIIDPAFTGFASFVLRTLFRVPPKIRETVLFGAGGIALPLQKALVRLLGGSSLVQTRFTEGPMAGDLFACWTSEKYFMLGSHVETEIQQQVELLLRPSQVAYDIGGYAGYMALLFSRLVGATGRVFTFEPSPLNYPRVRSNVDVNGRSNITIVDAAVSDHAGVASFKEGGSMSAIVGAAADHDAAGTRVKTIRLDDFVYGDGQPPPNFIKIDIEGHAGSALKGMPRILKECRPKVMCEVHDPCEEQQCIEVLSAHDYTLSALATAHAYPRWLKAGVA